MTESKIIEIRNRKYEVFVDGKVFRQLKDGSWEEVSLCTTGHGYFQVRIAGKKQLVHRLIWEAFNGPIPKGMQIDHINRVRTDNQLENLRLVTQTQNNRNKSNNVLSNELEEGLKCGTTEYLDAWATKHGYKNYTEYRDVWAQRKGYNGFNHYCGVMQAKRKAAKRLKSEYIGGSDETNRD